MNTPLNTPLMEIDPVTLDPLHSVTDEYPDGQPTCFLECCGRTFNLSTVERLRQQSGRESAFSCPLCRARQPNSKKLVRNITLEQQIQTVRDGGAEAAIRDVLQQLYENEGVTGLIEFLKPVIRANIRSAFVHLKDEFKDNTEFMLKVLPINTVGYQVASERLQEDEAFATAAMVSGMNGSCLRNTWTSNGQKFNVMLALVYSGQKINLNFGHASNSLKSNKAYVISCLERFKGLPIYRYCTTELLEQIDLFKDAVRLGQTNRCYEYAGPTVKDDETILRSVMFGPPNEAWIEGYTRASQRLRSDPNLLEDAITSGWPQAYRHADQSLHSDEVLLALALNNGYPEAYKMASSVLRDKKEILEMLIGKGLGTRDAYWPDGYQFASSRLRSDRNLFFEFFKERAKVYDYVAGCLKRDKDIFLTVLRTGNLASYAPLENAHLELKDDLEIVDAATALNRSNFQFASKRILGLETYARRMILQYGPKSIYEHLTDAAKASSDVFWAAMNEATSLTVWKKIVKSYRAATGRLKTDPVFLSEPTDAKRIVSYHGNLLELVRDTVSSTALGEIVQMAVQRTPSSLQYAPETYRTDKNTMRVHFAHAGSVLEFAGDNLRKDKTVLQLCMANNIFAIKYAHATLLRDEEFIAESCRIEASLFLYADNSLKENENFVTRLMNENVPGGSWKVFQYASEVLRSDKDIVRNFMKLEPRIFQFAVPEVRIDVKVCQFAVKRDGLLLQFVIMDSWEPKDTETIVRAAVTQNSQAFQWAPRALHKCVQFVQECVKRDGLTMKYANMGEWSEHDRRVTATMAMDQNLHSFEFAPEPLKSYKSFVVQAVQKNGLLLRFAAKEWRKDKDVVTAALMNDPDAFEFASHSLQSDPEMRKLAGREQTVRGEDVSGDSSESELDGEGADDAQGNSENQGSSKKRDRSQSNGGDHRVHKQRRSSRLFGRGQ